MLIRSVQTVRHSFRWMRSVKLKTMKKVIIARFNSKCAGTGKAIRKGTSMLYDTVSKKCYHKDSKAYDEHENGTSKSFDPAAGMIQANEDAYFDNWAQANGI